MATVGELKKELRRQGDPERVKVLRRFFKTGAGEYGQGDVFLGITVPVARQMAKKYQGLGLKDALFLLRSKIHEERLIALLILVYKFNTEPENKKRICAFYLRNTKYINNWDLVDSSAEYIVGPYLQEKSKAPILRLAKSKFLWERRIAMLSTFHYIKQGKPELALRVARLLLNDSHDLIQKAVGWMLREVGKRSLPAEERFLQKYCARMPRTMLRYAIERFPERERQAYLLRCRTRRG